LFDAGQPRALAETLEEVGDALGRPFGQHLHPAVLEVPHPARETEASGVFFGIEAVGHALDPAADENVHPDELFAHVPIPRSPANTPEPLPKSTSRPRPNRGRIRVPVAGAPNHDE